MRTLFLFLAFSIPAAAGWSKIYNVAIDRTKCGSSNLSNFPVLIFASDPSLKSTGNGGLVTNASGFDIVVATDTTIGTYVPWEVEKWDAVNGVIWFWAQIPTVNGSSAGSNTTFAVAWGNSAITSQQNTGSFASTAVWGDGLYYFVVHLAESTNPYNDSTSHANNSNAGTNPTQATGQIWDGQSFVQASSQFIQFPGSDAGFGGVGTVNYTFSGWIKTSATATNAVIIDTRSTHGCILFLATTTGFASFFCANFTAGTLSGAANLADGNFHYLVGTMGPGNVGTATLYVDGVSVNSESTAGFAGTNNGAITIDVGGKSGDSGFFTGLQDEVHISAGTPAGALRSADWIKTEYNNQKSPGNIGSANFLIWTLVASGGGFPIVQ